MFPKPAHCSLQKSIKKKLAPNTKKQKSGTIIDDYNKNINFTQPLNYGTEKKPKRRP